MMEAEVIQTPIKKQEITHIDMREQIQITIYALVRMQ